MADAFHVVCPHCDAVEPAPRSRPASDARCGSCKSKLFTGAPVELSADCFERHVSRSDIPVIADFWGPVVRPLPHHGSHL
jgi:thioredoxin 2